MLPTFSEPKASEAGVRVKMLLDVVPVPVKLMVCGEPVALSVMVTAAVLAPVVVGAKCP